MTKIGDEINELLQELKNEYEVKTIEPGDVTAEDFAKATGLGRRQCNIILSEKAKRGELISFKAKNNDGYFVKVYRKALPTK